MNKQLQNLTSQSTSPAPAHAALPFNLSTFQPCNFLAALPCNFFLALLLVICASCKPQQGDAAASQPTAKPLLVLAAASLKPGLEKAAAAYTATAGQSVQLQFGGSGSLVASLASGAPGDLLISADEESFAHARQKGLLAEGIPLARQQVCLAVAKGNPKKISSLSDLRRPEVRLLLCHPDAASIGSLCRRHLKEAWAPLQAKALALKPTVTEVAADLSVGAADATFLWDSMAQAYPQLELIALPELEGCASLAIAGLPASKGRPVEALAFARFLASPEHGAPIWKSAGLTPVPGDAWTPRPKLLVMAGSMLRPAVQPGLDSFAQREGCDITTVFEGCGTLTSQMSTGTLPELFVSCDWRYNEQMAKQMGSAEDFSRNDLVLAVAKGNPKDIKGLADLTRSDLRVGLAEPKRAALGILSAEALKTASIEVNPLVFSNSGDMLVSQLLSSSLDAALVYRSNVLSAPQTAASLDLIDCGLLSARQGLQIRADSGKAQISRRLADHLKSRQLPAGFSPRSEGK
ncbi:MAG: hypothetical protein RL095_2216 [Verrucomicrobiota bacterium]